MLDLRIDSKRVRQGRNRPRRPPLTEMQRTPVQKLKDGSSIKYLGFSRTENTELWKQASPVTYITEDDPPVLILHALNDATVDYSQSKELAQKLEQKGVEHQLHLLEKGGHTFSLKFDVKGKPLEADLSPIVLQFFDKHLKTVN